MSYPATVDVYEGAASLPFVLVNYPTVAPGCVALRIDQTSEGRTRTVRGGIGIAPATPRAVYEVGFNVPTTFRAEMFTDPSMAAGTSLGYTDAVSVTLHSDLTWIHQPLAPALAVAVNIDEGTAEQIVRPIPSELVWADDAALPRLSGKRRRGIVGMPLVIETETLAARNMLQALLGGYDSNDRQQGVLCVRTPGPAPLIPRLLFAALDGGELVEQGVNVNTGGSINRYPVKVTEALPPVPGLSSSILGYDDLDAAYPTGYSARDSFYPSYTAMDTDFSLAGAAG